MTTQRALLTAEDLIRLPDDGFRYELHDGELVKMAPAGGRHGKVSGQIAYIFLSDAGVRSIGEILTNDTGVIMRRNPDRVRAPDVSFIRRDRLPDGQVPEGYLELVPDLIVEVVSPGDTAAEVQDKVEEWLAAGARLVWAVYPTRQSVVAYRGLSDIRVYPEGEALDARPVLPDFSTPVSRIFA